MLLRLLTSRVKRECLGAHGARATSGGGVLRLLEGARAGRTLSTAPLDASLTRVQLTTSPKPKPRKETLVFGATMTDHMLEVDWDEQHGWHAPVISPYHALELDPASCVLHYGIEAFEGMKAYRDAEGRARLFRPSLNMARMARSMQKLALPPLDEAAWLQCIKRLVALETPWIPEGDGYSLYIRPTVIGTQPTLGVGPSKRLKLFAICCPVGPYYPEGFKPVRLLAEEAAVRAWPGGTGDNKLGGNYAPTIRVQVAAAARGYAQVLWLVGSDKQVTEVGTMNFFMLWRRPRDNALELITAPLDGTILPGVTRASMLELARSWGEFAVSEESFTIDDVTKALKDKRVLEMFGAGTAAVVAPVKCLHAGGNDYDVPLDPSDPTAGAGPLTRRFWTELADITYGRKASPWSVVV